MNEALDGKDVEQFPEATNIGDQDAGNGKSPAPTPAVRADRPCSARSSNRGDDNRAAATATGTATGVAATATAATRRSAIPRRRPLPLVPPTAWVAGGSRPRGPRFGRRPALRVDCAPTARHDPDGAGAVAVHGRRRPDVGPIRQNALPVRPPT